MDDKELIQMAESLAYRPQPNDTWVKAFRLYNGDPQNSKLQMGCMPCYPKVLAWHLRRRFANG